MTLALGLVAVSGNRARPSLFGTTLAQEAGFHRLAQVAPPDWRARAVTALAKYKYDVPILDRIASESERNAIRSWIGTPDQPGTLAAVAREVDAMLVPGGHLSQASGKVQSLEALVGELESKLKNAEQVFGTAAPAPAGAPAAANGWALPVAVLGAVAVAIGVWAVWGD